MSDATAYYPDAVKGEGSARTLPATGAGNNPSTWAGVLVLGSVALLILSRRSLRRYM